VPEIPAALARTDMTSFGLTLQNCERDEEMPGSSSVRWRVVGRCVSSKAQAVAFQLLNAQGSALLGTCSTADLPVKGLAPRFPQSRRLRRTTTMKSTPLDRGNAVTVTAHGAETGSAGGAGAYTRTTQLQTSTAARLSKIVTDSRICCRCSTSWRLASK
jgi:hypothetical protein